MMHDYQPLSARKAAIIGAAANRLASGLEALESAAIGAEEGTVSSVQVRWFCRVLLRDVVLCDAATHPHETEESLEEMAR